MNHYSLQAWLENNPGTAEAQRQRIIVELLGGPKTRDEIELNARIPSNSVRFRIDELINQGIIMRGQGEGTTRYGRKAEKIGLNEIWKPTTICADTVSSTTNG